MDNFGCCSLYEECSRALKCLRADRPEYGGCGYRRNLEDGRVFYGKGASGEPEDKRAPATNDTPLLFLFCFGRLFSIRARLKTGLSMKLSEKEAEDLREVFIRNSIPYKTSIASQTECVVDRPAKEDPSPANSRVVFITASGEYHALNFNDCLIKRSTARKVAVVLENHGIRSMVECAGKACAAGKVKRPMLESVSYSEVVNSVNEDLPWKSHAKISKANEIQKMNTSSEIKKSGKYSQVSITELMILNREETQERRDQQGIGL